MKLRFFVPKCFRAKTIEEFLKNSHDPRCVYGLTILEGRLGLREAADYILHMRPPKIRSLVAKAAKVESLSEADRVAESLGKFDTDLACAGVVIAYLRAYRRSRGVEQGLQALHKALKTAAECYKRHGERFLRYIKKISRDVIHIALRYNVENRALLIFDDVDIPEISPYKAELLYILGRNKEALRETEKAIHSKDEEIRARGRIVRAKILYSLGRLEEAKREAESVVREENGPVEEALELLARIELLKDNYPAAIYRAKELIRRIEPYDKLKLANALILIGDIFWKKNMRSSMKFYVKAIRIAAESRERLGINEAILMKAANRAAIIMALNDPGRAISFLESTRRFVLRSIKGEKLTVELQEELIYSLFLLASFYALKFRYKKALEYLSQLFYETSSIHERTASMLDLILKALSLYFSILKNRRGKEGLRRGIEKTKGIIEEALSTLSDLYPCNVDANLLYKVLNFILEAIARVLSPLPYSL